MSKTYTHEEVLSLVHEAWLKGGIQAVNTSEQGYTAWIKTKGLVDNIDFTINTKTLFEKGHFAGSTIAKDFNRSGYISIKFKELKDKVVPISVNGFDISSNICFWKLPKNNKENIENNNFFKRYFNDLEEENQKILSSHCNVK